MITTLKNLARHLCPDVYFSLRRQILPAHRLQRYIVLRQGLKIAAGPFAGMHYIPGSYGSRLMPKLIGSYEAELHPAITRVIQWQPAMVVDIGCAEGYYSVGLACALPRMRVAAFDLDERARAFCRDLAGLNMVLDRIDIRGACTTGQLNRLPLAGAFVISDCEGCEKDLLDPVNVPQLTAAVLLVELHDIFEPGATPLLLSRFSDTHQIQLIDVQQRDPQCYPLLRNMKPNMQQIALYERDPVDPPQQWAFCVPKNLNI